MHYLELVERAHIGEKITKEEIGLARRHYEIVRNDSRIGFESFMQYFFRPANILEKIANCQYILNHHIPVYKKAQDL